MKASKQAISRAIPSIREMWTFWYPIGTTGVIKQGVQRQIGRAFLEYDASSKTFDCSIWETGGGIPGRLFEGNYEGCEIWDILVYWMHHRTEWFSREYMVEAIQKRLAGDETKYE